MMDIIIQIDGQDEVETDKAIDIYNSLQKNHSSEYDDLILNVNDYILKTTVLMQLIKNNFKPYYSEDNTISFIK